MEKLETHETTMIHQQNEWGTCFFQNTCGSYEKPSEKCGKHLSCSKGKSSKQHVKSDSLKTCRNWSIEERKTHQNQPVKAIPKQSETDFRDTQ